MRKSFDFGSKKEHGSGKKSGNSMMAKKGQWGGEKKSKDDYNMRDKKETSYGYGAGEKLRADKKGDFSSGKKPMFGDDKTMKNHDKPMRGEKGGKYTGSGVHDEKYERHGEKPMRGGKGGDSEQMQREKPMYGEKPMSDDKSAMKGHKATWGEKKPMRGDKLPERE